MTRQLVTGAILVIAAAHLAICAFVLLGLSRTGQLRTNPLGLATAAVAVVYLSLRGSRGGLRAPAGLFEDLRQRRHQALEINDNIVQGLARVKWALEAERTEEARAAADETLAAAQAMVTDLLWERPPGDGPRAGGLLRASAGAADTSAE